MRRSRTQHKKGRALGNRLWGALMIDGDNGIRKGAATVWQVVTLDGVPTMVTHGHVPAVAVRPMRDDDIIDGDMAITVLESMLDTLRAYQEMGAVTTDVETSSRRCSASESSGRFLLHGCHGKITIGIQDQDINWDVEVDAETLLRAVREAHAHATEPLTPH